MRNRLMIVTAALLLASAHLGAGAEQQARPATTPSRRDSIDFGGAAPRPRGDEARYERYRDLRDGAQRNFCSARRRRTGLFDFMAQNIGYRDQRYELDFHSTAREVRVRVRLDAAELQLRLRRRRGRCTAGDLHARRRAAHAVQTRAGRVGGARRPSRAARPAGVDLQLDRQARSTCSQRRDTIGGDAADPATDNLDLTVGVQHATSGPATCRGARRSPSTTRTSCRCAIDNRTNDLSAGVEWASHQGMFRVGYEHSTFNQNIPSFDLGQPDAGDRLLQRTAGRPRAPARPERLQQRQRAGLRADGAAAVATPWTASAGWAWSSCRRTPPSNASFAGRATSQDEAYRLDDQLRHREPGGLRGLPGARRAARETAEAQVNYTTATLNLTSRPNRNVTLARRATATTAAATSHRQFDARRSTSASTRCPRRPAASRAVQHQPQHARRQRHLQPDLA